MEAIKGIKKDPVFPLAVLEQTSKSLPST